MHPTLEPHDVLTNGIRLHMVQCGPVEGPLVIMRHGFPEYWETWHKQMPALVAAGYRVRAPNQRGYNRSNKPRGIRHYSIPVLAAGQQNGALHTLLVDSTTGRAHQHTSEARKKTGRKSSGVAAVAGPVSCTCWLTPGAG